MAAAHIHLTADGGRAIVVAEWTDAASHDAAATTAATDAPGFKRYTLHHSLLNGGAQGASGGA
ncbi:hypothetical protein [Kitasatospora sp. NPDC050463]|uniref:hypothetical protein n=1 Tax=Kitasatospora sp. NPDC050463 TaxID=3155786 RepID=UPI0033FD7067